jgi:hypothetical protein
VTGSKANLAYDHLATHTRIRASLELGLDRWCALADAPQDTNGRHPEAGPSPQKDGMP